MDNHTRSQLIEARRYIKRRDYGNARYILLQTNSKIADKWLKKINRMDSTYTEETDYSVFVIIFVVSILTMFGLYVMTGRIIVVSPIIILMVIAMSVLSRHKK